MKIRTPMIFAKRNLPLALLCLSAQVILGLCIARCYLVSRNTIHNNGNWISIKRTVEKDLVGADNFFFKPQALAKGRLNLGAWHGFQEVIYKDKLSIKEAALDFLLEPDSYLDVIFNKDEEGFSGIRLSVNRNFESFYFTASDNGEFKEKVTIAPLNLLPETRHNLKITFGKNILIDLDNNEVGNFTDTIKEKQAFGFRGGMRNAYVDNLKIQSKETGWISESFNKIKYTPIITLLSVLAAITFNALVVLILFNASGMTGKYIGFTIVMIDLALIISASFLYGFQYVRAEYYPVVDEARKSLEEEWKHKTAAEVVENIKDKYGARDKDTYRILFLGTSQTWGAGASKESKTFVNLIEKKLNDPGLRDADFECINAGIAAVESAYLLDLYEKEWLSLEPAIVVINLSTNDSDADLFKANINELIGISLKNGVKPVLVLEPNSPEREDPFFSFKHGIMKQAGVSGNIPSIDMHGYLNSRSEDGFLWWDRVHLTDYGHQLFAEKLHKIIHEILKFHK